MKLLKNFLTVLEEGGRYETTLYPTLDMPLINQDLEGHPLDARITSFREAVQAAPIVVLATPEYNASLSPVLKNAVDWASRPPASVWTNKIVVLLAASPGALGGARGLIQLRTVMSGLKCWVIPEQVQCPFADKAFDAGGALVEERVKKQLLDARQGLDTFAGIWLAPR